MLVRGNEVINQIPTALTADHHPCGAILHLHRSWLQRQWLAQCQWHCKTYLILALLLLLWNQSPALAVSAGTHSSTPAAPVFNDPLHLLCSTPNTARLISAPSTQTSSHWHFVPARDFSRWHFTQKTASMSLAVQSKAKAAHAGDALTQRKPALGRAWHQAILAQYLQNLPGSCCALLLSGGSAPGDYTEHTLDTVGPEEATKLIRGVEHLSCEDR